MFRVVTGDESANYANDVKKIRHVFAETFSRHYAKLIKEAQAGAEISIEENVDVDIKAKRSAKIRASIETLKGFTDLIHNKFAKDVNKFTSEEIQYAAKLTDLQIVQRFTQKELEKHLHQVYFGGGFDDEAAFLMAWQGFHQQSEKSLAEYAADRIVDLNAPNDYITEVSNYLNLLEKDGRQLKEVNFVALKDNLGKMAGFCIYHVFEQNGQTILHIRQAAMLNQDRGYVSQLANELIQKYPHAIYEANQRYANDVPMKKKLLSESLLIPCQAHLGYNKARYLGLRSRTNVRTHLAEHTVIAKEKEAAANRKVREAEFAIPARLFKPQTDVAKRSCADDMFIRPSRSR